ncbi:MAG: BolA family transcriptional regulator [Gammaproteobacteria bacterium]|nr:BolA family transcriptional regulator [Gammaproteobacteria bacterium]
MSRERVERMRALLLAALAPVKLEIEDDSRKHAGHAGAAGGAGHFNVLVVSPLFSGKGLLARHRMVYDALDSMMHSEIHALSIRALAPEEFHTHL